MIGPTYIVVLFIHVPLLCRIIPDWNTFHEKLINLAAYFLNVPAKELILYSLAAKKLCWKPETLQFNSLPGTNSLALDPFSMTSITQS